MALRKATDWMLGRARVGGRAPAPGATGSAAGEPAAWDAEAEAGLGCGLALVAGLALLAGLAVLAGLAGVELAGAEGWAPLPQAVSKAAAMTAAASGVLRANRMPSPAALTIPFRVQPTLVHAVTRRRAVPARCKWDISMIVARNGRGIPGPGRPVRGWPSSLVNVAVGLVPPRLRAASVPPRQVPGSTVNRSAALGRVHRGRLAK
jgi:hypothetical protein